MAAASIMIDQREPEWVRKLTFGEDIAVAVTLLDVGDVLVATDSGDLLAVERKTASDFLNTLRDERLFPQLARMRELTPWCYLALCGTLHPAVGGKCFCNGVETGWNWSSVAGALLTVQEIGVHILHVPSDAEFEAAIVRLANRDRGALRVQPPRGAAMVSDAEAILTALPGIGPEKAQSLLAYCGSPAWALTYLANDSWQGPTAPGLGEGTRRRIRKALELPEWAALSVVVKDTDEVAKFEKEKAVG